MSENAKGNPSNLLLRLSPIAAVVLICLSLPLSNLFVKRTYVAPENDPEFKTVSDVLVRKCADCHTQDLAVHPLYFGFPVADSIIHRNIKKGQASFLLNRDKLSGKTPFSAADLERLSAAMIKNNMPPAQYLALHWGSVLTESEQRTLAVWARKKLKVYDLRPIPVENFLKPDPLKAALGQHLFNDGALSIDGTVSCASCHQLDKGGTDQLRVAKRADGKPGSLNTPTVLNSAYSIRLYWDGRAKDLKEQAFMAISNPQEMGSNWQQAIENLKKNPDFVKRFLQSYPDGVTADGVSDALAEYERTLLTPGSRYDKFLAGDSSALSAEEKEGFEVFKKHECYDCHSGPALGDLSFETLGYNKSYYVNDAQTTEADKGRFNITHNKFDMHRFKVPSLRNVELTHPYLHDGSAKTLSDVIKIMSEYQVPKPLSDGECKKVEAFLHSLTGTINGKPLTTHQ